MKKVETKKQHVSIHKDYVLWNMLRDAEHHYQVVRAYVTYKLSSIEYDKEKWNQVAKAKKRLDKACEEFDSQIAEVLNIGDTNNEE